MLDKLTPPSSEDVIIKHWKYIDKIYVSCVCITYNHESFIKDTIDAMLAQKTEYKFEIIIHDDVSNDKTREIIESYKEQYPNIIRLVLQEENQYSKGRRITPIAVSFSKGDYIALCEGDDYWTDSLKLQKQVTFLEENPDYILSYHDAYIIDSDGHLLKKSKMPDNKKIDLTESQLSRCKGFPLTMSWMYRNINLGDYSEINKVKNGDTFLSSILGLHGKGKYHQDILPAAYRMHSGGIWSAIDKNQKIFEIINTYFWLFKYHSRVKSPYVGYFSLVLGVLCIKASISVNGLSLTIKNAINLLLRK